MKTHRRSTLRLLSLVIVVVTLTFFSTRLKADTGTCGGATITLPFTDVAAGNVFFCSIAEAFFSGLTNGTSATTYSPDDPVSRQQMAAFTTRTLDQSLKRGNRRTVLGTLGIIPSSLSATVNPLGSQIEFIHTDGHILWTVYGGASGSVSGTRLDDYTTLRTYTSVQNPVGVFTANGLVFITGSTNPGKLYFGGVNWGSISLISANLGPFPIGVVFDGENVWTANYGTAPNTGSISRSTVNNNTTTTFTNGYSRPYGILYDGANLWITDEGNIANENSTLKRIDRATGGVNLTVEVGKGAGAPVFDGTNIWVPNKNDNTISVVRAVGGLTGTVLATFSGNGMNLPVAGAFDGERVVFTNNGEGSVSLWNATSLAPLGSASFQSPGNRTLKGICSDGGNFFVAASGNAAGVYRF